MRLWIEEGAPRDGVITDPAHPGDKADHVAKLLHVCDDAPPTGRPTQNTPTATKTDLAPPAPEEGIQLRMPPYEIAPGSEWEGCFASYYDVGAKVPTAFKTPDGNTFFVKETEILQSEGSHHFVVMHSGFQADRLSDPAFGNWTCKGGTTAGSACDPKQTASCGPDGFCVSATLDGQACIGFGPLGSSANPSTFGLGTALQASVRVGAIPGVYREIPTRGILYWNLHAFNLKTAARTQRAWLNLLFAEERKLKETHATIVADIPNVQPFTKQDVCATWEVPANTKIIRMTSHTHRHGKRFWVKDPSGNVIYESFAYDDPVYKVFDPWLDFAGKTLEFCATFNNGLRDDGTFDTEFVSRKSRVPSYAFPGCTATACTAGRVGAKCGGDVLADLLGFGNPGANAECDSTPGAGDGQCDACPLSFGQTTEEEMFTLNPDTVSAAN